MSKRTIATYMTPSPHTVGRNQPLAVAHRIMRDHRIRHLPVLDAGRLVGIVTDRDLHLIETLDQVDPSTVRVDEAMSSPVYVVFGDTPTADVVRHMADRKVGSAVVVDHGAAGVDHVIGVFTTVDALRMLSVVLEARARSARYTEPHP